MPEKSIERAALLPCPFCGGDADFTVEQRVEHPDYGGHSAMCFTCGAGIGYVFACKDSPHQRLSEMWNKRQARAGAKESQPVAPSDDLIVELWDRMLGENNLQPDVLRFVKALYTHSRAEAPQPVTPIDVEASWGPVKSAYFEGFNDGAGRSPTDDGSWHWEQSNAIHTQEKSVQPADERQDAERYRAIRRWTVDNNWPDTAELSGSVQPHGYNGSKWCWIEFGWPGEEWHAITAEEMDTAIDAARAAIAPTKEQTHDTE